MCRTGIADDKKDRLTDWYCICGNKKRTDDSIAATLGTIDASTITTTDALYTFTNTSNTYAIQAGDKLLIE
jgi:hypothetical protein